MRLLVDATPLLLRSAGIKNHLWHWLGHLRRLAGPDAVRAFPCLRDRGRLVHDRSVLPGWRTLPRIALLHSVNHLNLPSPTWLARDADLVHLTNQLRRVPRGKLLTATLHDVTTGTLPELHTAANVRADRAHADAVLRRADGLIAVSESTRQDAIRLLGLAPERIATIHPGVAAEFFAVAAGSVARVRRRYRLDRPFVLFVGALEPRKNLDTLLDAWSLLSGELRSQHELVLAGPMGWAAEATRRRLLAPDSGCRLLGYVPEPDLPALTAAATAFIYPSLWEGFGFPVAQAMAAGVPVVTSEVSSLPEITAGAALLVDPRSPNQIAGAIARLLGSEALRRDLSARGRSVAARYTWERCAQQSLAFLRSVVGRGPLRADA
jgi:alpha-1,3-rhamnosyl/mannosyltransferase